MRYIVLARSFGITCIALTLALSGCPSSDDDDSAMPDDDAADDDAADDDAADDDVADDDAADDDAADDDAADDDSADPVEELLTNFPASCSSWSAVMPLAGEEGHLAAGRLTPPSWPFTVDRVVYSLLHGSQDGLECNAEYAHRVELFTGTSPTPDASPTAPTVEAVPEDEVSGAERLVVVDLDPPLTIEQDEHLFVAVELVGSYPDVGCLSLCNDGQTYDDRNWWSNATAAPYSWAQLADYGVPGNLVVVAYGSVGP